MKTWRGRVRVEEILHGEGNEEIDLAIGTWMRRPLGGCEKTGDEGKGVRRPSGRDENLGW